MRCDSFYIEGQHSFSEMVYDYLLNNGPKNVTAISEDLYMPSGAVMINLGKLQKENKVKNEWVGTEIFFSAI